MVTLDFNFRRVECNRIYTEEVRVKIEKTTIGRLFQERGYILLLLN
jgi:hypothetical protein